VFLKDTMDHQHDEVLADRPFLAEARHAFLIRRPEEIAASYYALFPPMTINAIGMQRLCGMQAAISDAGGNPPIVIDSDELVARPAATMAAYCTAVGLPFNSRALTWEPGERAEWQRSACWHTDASNSSGFKRRERTYLYAVERSPPVTGPSEGYELNRISSSGRGRPNPFKLNQHHRLVPPGPSCGAVNCN
jgi:hypothetical protein